MKIIDIVKELQNGKTVEQVEEELRAIDMECAEEEGKVFGICIACGQETCLVSEVDLCGPCCFGEADTANGNW